MFGPRHNIAPGQLVAAVWMGDGGASRLLECLRWGLVPSWAKDAAIGQRMVNARAETVVAKPAFRAAFLQRRCLIPADGFYEWETRHGSPKQPYLFERSDGRLFAFAGLFEIWHPGGPDELHTCTVITTCSNGVLAEVHDRAPVILGRRDYAAWIDPTNTDLESLQALLAPGPEDALVRRTVGLRVNDVRNDDAECAAPAPPQPRQAELW